ARCHLRSVLPANADISKYDHLMSSALHPDNVIFGLTRMPDRIDGQDDLTIREWEKRRPTDREFLSKLESPEMHRSWFFMARTCLYGGFTNVQRLAFVADTTWAPLVGMISKRENDLRGSLLATLDESNRRQAETEPDEIWETITPLAAIVLSRAQTRSAIA